MTEANSPLLRMSLRDQLSRRLERQILDHEIMPGEILPSERELMESWGVSRSVVRDAIRILESQGLIEVRQGIGAVVTGDVREAFARALELLIERSQYSLSELMLLRMALEAEAAGLAALHASAEDLAKMEALLDEHAAAVQTGDFVRAVEADRAFHLCIIQATYSEPLIDLIAPLVRSFMLKTLFMAPGGGPRQEDNVKHRELFQRIRARDPRGASQQMRVTLLDGFATLRRQDEAAQRPASPVFDYLRLSFPELIPPERSVGL